MNITDRVDYQVIAAVRNKEEMEAALKSKVSQIFLLFGSIMDIIPSVEKIKAAQKEVYIHYDFVAGLAMDKFGMKYMGKVVQPTGIISTRSHLISLAKEYGLLTIQRIFLIDSSAINSSLRAIKSSKPDAIEIMPGLMPKVIHQMTERTHLPVIAGGLIGSEEEVLAALRAGALAVSVGSSKLWNMDMN